MCVLQITQPTKKPIFKTINGSDIVQVSDSILYAALTLFFTEGNLLRDKNGRESGIREKNVNNNFAFATKYFYYIL